MSYLRAETRAGASYKRDKITHYLYIYYLTLSVDEDLTFKVLPKTSKAHLKLCLRTQQARYSNQRFN